MRIDQILKELFLQFAERPGASRLGKFTIQIPEHDGSAEYEVNSIYFPTTDPETGCFVSLSVRLDAVVGRIDRMVKYSNAKGFTGDSDSRTTRAYLESHLDPVKGTPQALFAKEIGHLVHLAPNGRREIVKIGRVAEPKVKIDGEVIVISCMNLDQNFSRVAVEREAEFAENAIEQIFDLMIADLAELPLIHMDRNLTG